MLLKSLCLCRKGKSLSAALKTRVFKVPLAVIKPQKCYFRDNQLFQSE